MVAILKGRLDWELLRDVDGHREYSIAWLVRTTGLDDGPGTVMLCPELPQIGSYWAFGNESDPWAFCMPDWSVQRVNRREQDIWWTVLQTFSTRPLRRCQDMQIENPILEPPDISGTFLKWTEEVKKNKDGALVRTSSHELVRGPLMEFDKNRPTVTIRINTLNLDLETFSDKVDHVNDSRLWGLDPRCVKLSNVSWQRQLYGMCNFYFTKTFEFEVDKRTFDRNYPDIGHRVLKGWAPGSRWAHARIDPDALDSTFGNLPAWLNPANFEIYKDINGENTEVFLDGKGRPLADGADIVEGTIEYYPETNFLELGVPSNLETGR